MTKQEVHPTTVFLLLQILEQTIQNAGTILFWDRLRRLFTLGFPSENKLRLNAFPDISSSSPSS